MPISGIEIWKPLNNSLDSKYLLAVLNSNLVSYYFKWYVLNLSKLTTHLNSTYLERLPFVISSERDVFATLAEYMLTLNQSEKLRTLKAKLISRTNLLLNALIYELFFAEKFGNTDNELAAMITNSILPADNPAIEDKTLIITNSINRVFNMREAERVIMDIMNWNWVRTIETRLNNCQQNTAFKLTQERHVAT